MCVCVCVCVFVCVFGRGEFIKVGGEFFEGGGGVRVCVGGGEFCKVGGRVREEEWGGGYLKVGGRVFEGWEGVLQSWHWGWGGRTCLRVCVCVGGGVG